MTRTSKNTSKMHIILRWSILCAFLLFSTISLVIQSTKYRVQHVSDRLCLSSNKENFDAPHALKLNVQIRLFQAGTLNWLTNSNWIYKIEFIHVEFDMLSCFVWFEICSSNGLRGGGDPQHSCSRILVRNACGPPLAFARGAGRHWTRLSS